MSVYSLTHYQVVITLPENMKKYLKNSDAENGLIFGGSGSYLESIEINLNNDIWTTTGDYTGSWIHTMNANRTGNVLISLNQVSKNTKLLNTLINLYYAKTDEKSAYNNLAPFPTITVNNTATGEVVATANDCFIKKPVNRKYGNETAFEVWEFTCGEVIINGINN